VIPNRKKKWCDRCAREQLALYLQAYRARKRQDRQAEELRRAVYRRSG
jgi:hypothetical protein